MPCHRQGSLTVGWRSPGKDEFYIFRHMTGQDLPPGQSLAEKGRKGVTRAILALRGKVTVAPTRVFSSTSTRDVAEHFRC
jgi:hypothetical protein